MLRTTSYSFIGGFLFLLLLVAPVRAHAEDFFDNQAMALKIIDGSLSEGMMTGHHGLILKTASFMDQATQAKDAASKTLFNKISW